MAYHQPFALFVLAEMSNETLNGLLSRANRLDAVELNIFVPASADLSDAPSPRTDNEVNTGVSLPISDYTSPFVGRSIQEVGDLLRNAGPAVDLVREYFAVIDAKSDATKTFLICKNYDEGHTEWYRIEDEDAATELGAMLPGKFETHKEDLDRIYPH